jgi:hypothetical protein
MGVRQEISIPSEPTGSSSAIFQRRQQSTSNGVHLLFPPRLHQTTVVCKAQKHDERPRSPGAPCSRSSPAPRPSTSGWLPSASCMDGQRLLQESRSSRFSRIARAQSEEATGGDDATSARSNTSMQSGPLL